MGSLTSNLHALFTSFYKPTPKRHKIMCEGKAFPSDQVSPSFRKAYTLILNLMTPFDTPQYAFASQIALHDYPPTSLLAVDPRPGEYTIRTDDILKVIEEEGDSIAIICFGAVQYYSGEWFDMEKITKAGHEKVSFFLLPLLSDDELTPISLLQGMLSRVRLRACRRKCTDVVARLGCRFCLLVLLQVPQLGARGNRRPFRPRAVGKQAPASDSPSPFVLINSR
jgi:hypothetical protein